MHHFHSLGQLNGEIAGSDDHLPASGLVVPAWAPALRDHEERNISKQDPLAYFIGQVPEFVEMARQAAANDVDSYRVAVGGLAMAIKPRSGKIGIFTSGNFKYVVPEDEGYSYEIGDDIVNCPKVCAEGDMIARAREAGFTRMAGLVVVGPTNKNIIKGITFDDDENVPPEMVPPTLEPCDVCLDVFEGTDIVGDRTLIMTIGNKSNIYKVQTVEEIKNTRKSNDIPTPAREYNPNKAIWAARKNLYQEKLDSNNLPQHLANRVRAVRDVARVTLAKEAMLRPSLLLATI
jgi:hypothetical protein